MRRVFAIVCAIFIAAGVLGASAAAAGTETLTMTINFTSPSGHTLIGTYVVQRGGAGGQASWTFNGMLDGKQVTASGSAVEQWDAAGNGTIELTAINLPGLPLEKLPLRTIQVSANNSGVIVVQGVPLAISGPLRAPGSGNTVLTVTNAGRGAQPIASLPNTAGNAPLAPQAVALLLGLAGAGLLLGARRWRGAGEAR